jgi:hypothetical protein
MHQGQDTFSHMDAGINPIMHAILSALGFSPDDPATHAEALAAMREWTAQQEEKWKNKPCAK